MRHRTAVAIIMLFALAVSSFANPAQAHRRPASEQYQYRSNRALRYTSRHHGISHERREFLDSRDFFGRATLLNVTDLRQSGENHGPTGPCWKMTVQMIDKNGCARRDQVIEVFSVIPPPSCQNGAIVYVFGKRTRSDHDRFHGNMYPVQPGHGHRWRIVTEY